MAKHDPLVDCPRCGGFPEFDEEGKLYTCFFCCDSGRVLQSVAEAEERLANEMAAEREAEVAARRKALGVPDGWGYIIDEYEGKVVLIPPRSTTPPTSPADLYAEDIPF